MTRILIGGFLIARGLVHIGVWGLPKLQTAEGSPFIPSDSWLIGSTKGLAAVLAVLYGAEGATCSCDGSRRVPGSIVEVRSPYLMLPKDEFGSSKLAITWVEGGSSCGPVRRSA